MNRPSWKQLLLGSLAAGAAAVLFAVWSGHLSLVFLTTEVRKSHDRRARARDITADRCQGAYKGQRLTPAEIAEALQQHLWWIATKGAQGAMANLCLAILDGANFENAILLEADLSGSLLRGANLRGAYLASTNLNGADLSHADLTDASAQTFGFRLVSGPPTFWGARLEGARLQRVRNFGGAFRDSIIVRTDLRDADLFATDFDNALFEPLSETVPTIRGVARFFNLHTLKYPKDPAALVALRDEYKRRGLRDREREITYAIRHWDLVRSLEAKETSALEALFAYLAFELPCLWGWEYGRPLRIMGYLIPLFGLVYACAIKWPGRRGIWIVWPSDRVERDQVPETARVTDRLQFRGALIQGEGPVSRHLRALRYGLQFSILSAFHVGWRDLNVGTWISRIQPNEYAMRATGWVRTLSSLQSLISVYMLALWALSYFGRPFE